MGPVFFRQALVVEPSASLGSLPYIRRLAADCPQHDLLGVSSNSRDFSKMPRVVTLRAKDFAVGRVKAARLVSSERFYVVDMQANPRPAALTL